MNNPRLRGVDVEWDEILDDLGTGISSVVEAEGPDAVALYLATGLAYDSAGQVAAGMWLGGLGSSAFYSAATVDNAPVLVAAELVAGHPMLNPVWQPDRHGLLLVVGCNPVVSHGYGTTLPDPVRYLRDHRRGGGRLWVIDPRTTETAALADRHLSVRPGADVQILAALCGALLESGADEAELTQHCDPAEVLALRRALEPFSFERAAAAAGIEEGDLVELLDDIRQHHGRVAAFCGTGTTMARDGVLVEWLRWVLLILSGSLDRSDGMRFNRGAVNLLRPRKGGAPGPGPRSRPELRRVAGQMPAVALADEIEAGEVRALVVTGGNPLHAFPEPDRLRDALATLQVLAVVDVADSELVDMATHVLPATGQLERADLSLAENVSLRSGIQATAAVVPPVGHRRPTWWIMASLGQRCGVDLLGGSDPDAVTETSFLSSMLARGPLDPAAVWANGAHGTDVDVDFGWVKATMLPGGRWRIAPPELIERLAARSESSSGLLLVPRREMEWSNSVRFGESEAPPELLMSPADALTASLADGDRVEVKSRHGRVAATVRIDDAIVEGVVSLPHGRAASPVGRLTSASHDVDPLTGMPHTSGFSVTVSGIAPDG
ncbi:MAG: molybdopterin-dependent oxidoreductase [Acidimicrobiales bacterium]